MQIVRNIIFLLIISFSINHGQDSNTVKYSLFLEKSVVFGTVDTKVIEGEFKEGESFVIPDAILPSSPIDFFIYQDLYSALVGGRFGIDYGALNNDIILKIFIRNLNPGKGVYNNLSTEQDTLFSYFEMRIWELPDSNFFHENSNYYFNDGYHAQFSLPKSDALSNFLDVIGISREDNLAFAYLENDNDGGEKWNSDGIITIDEPDSIKFKAIHLSRIGGGRRRIANNTTTSISINELSGIPKNFNLNQNYPNPFNPTTKISYSITKSGIVKLSIYNMLGKHIETLISKHQQVGNYEIEFSSMTNNDKMASGIYLYTLQSNDGFLTKKMILLK